MKRQDFNDFRPTINGCSEAEPTLENILAHYYHQAFVDPVQCHQLAREYMDKLAEFISLRYQKEFISLRNQK